MPPPDAPAAEAAPAAAPAAPDPGANGKGDPSPAEPEGPSELEVLQGKHRDTQLASGRLEQSNRALTTERDTLAEKVAAAETLAEKLRTNPLEALKEYGHTMQALTDHVIDSEQNPETPEQARMRTLEETVTQLTEKLTGTNETLDTERASVTRSGNLNIINEYISDNAEEFGMLKLFDKGDTVLSIIEQDAQTRGSDYTADEKIQTLRDSEKSMRGMIVPQLKGLADLPWGRELLEAAMKPADDPSTSPKDKPADKKPTREKGKPQTSISNADASATTGRGEPKRATHLAERHKRAAARVAQNRAERQ